MLIQWFDYQLISYFSIHEIEMQSGKLVYHCTVKIYSILGLKANWS